jgi:hypothetical protein
MKNQVRILIGSPLRGEEASFLRVLSADLASTGALILANFVVRDRQIDFFVVLEHYAALLELKTLPRPIFGDRNGAWVIQDASGNQIEYSRENPWQQTLEETFALSDEMKAYRRSNPSVPAPPDSGYYRNFKSFVCVNPQIHRDSRVTAGDSKVLVSSYADIRDAIRSKTIKTTWTQHDWEMFAEQKLHLTAVSLQAAIDPKALAAQSELTAYRQRVKALVETDLAPLVDGTDDELYGSSVLRLLEEPSNYLLHGPSGSAKTFHLHHLALALAAGDRELPFFIDAKRYTGGDFWHLLRQLLATYSPSDPKQLLSAMQLSGYRPVLLIDALNELAESLRADFMKGALAFVLHFDARAIVTAQDPTITLGGLQTTPVLLKLPNKVQKRQIYAYYAEVPPTPELDRFCEGFTNAYDLALAGRCHASGVPPQLRVEIYDRYVNSCVPPKQTVVASALLRHLAGIMNDSVSFIMPKHQCTYLAEEFLRRHDTGFGLLDLIFESRLVQVTSDSFAFEHELLFKYLKAEHLWRTTASVAELASELRKPRHHDLLEYILPRFTNESDIALLLTSSLDVMTLRSVFAGRCGITAQTVLKRQCEDLLQDAIKDLPNVHIELTTISDSDDKPRLSEVNVTGSRPWTEYDFLLSELIAYALEDQRLRHLALQLLDETEATLKRDVKRAAHDAGFSFNYVWSETIRFFTQWVVMPLPSCKLLSSIRNMFNRWDNSAINLVIRPELLKRVVPDLKSTFCLFALVEDHTSAADPKLVPENLDLIEAAWNTGIVFLRMNALHMLNMNMRLAVSNAKPEQTIRVHTILESFQTQNVFINSLIAEALSSYEAIEPPVSVETAVGEMREVIDPAYSNAELSAVAERFEMTPGDLIAKRAYGLLGNIFENVFQDAYSVAYDMLSQSEKVSLLSLAATKPDIGFHSSWILQQLLLLADESSLPLFQSIAGTIDHEGSFFQDAVATFTLAIQGCARWSDQPPVYRSTASASDRAWLVFSEELFWFYHAKRSGTHSDRSGQIWSRLGAEERLAAGVILSNLSGATSYLSMTSRQDAPDFNALWREDVLKIAYYCLANRVLLAKTFWRHSFGNHSVAKHLIQALGEVGDRDSISSLQELVDDAILGRGAIHAIELIQRRTGQSA